MIIKTNTYLDPYEYLYSTNTEMNVAFNDEIHTQYCILDS